MATLSEENRAGPHVVQVDSFTKPAWVSRVLGNDATTADPITIEGLSVQVTEAEGLCYVQAVLPDAVDLEWSRFECCVTRAYAVVRDQLEQRRARHPLRFWNFVPGIHRPAEDGMVCYEVFNAGRFAAFADWYQTPRFGPWMVAASGIGHRRPEFIVQVLAAERPGRGLENPRQRSAYRYSKRYGPIPPCFARATVADAPAVGLGQGVMIVSGTASIVGEDTRHRGDLDKQLEETCQNLTSLLGLVDVANGQRRDPLSRFRELRAYVTDDASRNFVVDRLADRFRRLRRLELMSADICRTDLMVEVEGVVSLGAGPALDDDPANLEEVSRPVLARACTA